MRELKFRAWDSVLGRMWDDFNFIKTGDETSDWVVPIIVEDGWEENVEPFTRRRFHIMQYTGFKTPTGKEVYEGDVVKTKSFYINKTHMRVIGKVEYRRNGFAVVGIRKYNGIIIYDFPYDLEALGNIYEQPHLLETKDIVPTESARAVE